MHISKYSPLKSIHFYRRLNQLSQHFCHSDWGISRICILNASDVFSGFEKRWPLILFLMYGNEKKSFGPKSGLYCGWLNKSIFWEVALSWWGVVRLRRLVFLTSWKTTVKQMFVYHLKLTVLSCSRGTNTTWPCFPKKKIGDHLLGIRGNPRFIICHDVIDAFRSTAIVFFEHFYRSIDTSFFWAIDKLCGIQLEIFLPTH